MEAVTVLEDVSARVSRGEALSRDDAAAILATKDIIAVGVLADDARRRLHGAATTFVRVLEVQTGVVPPQLPPRADAGEIRIVGAPRSTEEAVEAVKAAASLAPGVPLTGFSLADLWELAGGREFGGLCTRLRDAGLTGVSEVPIDRLSAPDAAVRAARAVGLDVLRLTVHAVAGDSRIEIFERAQRLQGSLGGIRAFAPLPRVVPAGLPTTGYDDVKTVALARLLVTAIESIQVDWSLYGPKLAQVALTMGADDVDAVAAVDVGALGVRRSAKEEILRNIRAAGLEPVERDGRFAPRAR